MKVSDETKDGVKTVRDWIFPVTGDGRPIYWATQALVAFALLFLSCALNIWLLVPFVFVFYVRSMGMLSYAENNESETVFNITNLKS